MENKNNVVHLQSRVVPVMSSWLANPIWLGKRRFESCQLYFNTNKTMETKRREILDKWFAAFQLSIGYCDAPLTDHAAEYLEAAMQEYADLNSK